jgi:hypothetical protein
MSFSSISSTNSRGKNGTINSFMIIKPLFTSRSSPDSNSSAACSFNFLIQREKEQVSFLLIK